MYIWDLYPTIREGKLESSSSSSGHQAQNIIAKPPIAPSHNLSHILPISFICAIPPSTAPLLPLPYCNPSCFPLASLLLQKSLFEPKKHLIQDRLVLDFLPGIVPKSAPDCCTGSLLFVKPCLLLCLKLLW